MVLTSNSSWMGTTLGEILEIFDYKRIPLSGTHRKESQGGYPYYGASGVIDYIDDYIFDGRYLLIAEDGENLNSRKLPVAFSASGKFWVNNHAHIVRAIPGIAEDYFIFAWFVQANISGYITGAAQPKLTQENLKRIALRLPPLPTQRKIAAILSAYDNLFENNTRRIRILEEMAQAIYREWFIHFRYPGHENVSMVESELGLIPEGWEVVRLGNLIEFKKGKKPNNYCLEDDIGSLPIFLIEGLNSGVTAFTSDKKLIIAEKDDVIMVMDGASSGKCYIRYYGALGSTLGRYRSINKSLLSPYHLFFTLDQNFRQISDNNTGAAIPHANKDFINQINILIPINDIRIQFHRIAENILLLRENLRNRNINLCQQRDLLLPRLISGELDVSELDIAVPEDVL